LLEVEELDQDGWQFSGPVVFEIDAYYERSLENGMDPIHNEFVHPAQGAPSVDDDRVEVADDQWGCHFSVDFAGYKDTESHDRVVERDDSSGDLRAGTRHIGPNAMVTEIHVPGNNSFIQYFYEAPVGANKTRIFFVNERNNNLDPKLDEGINASFMKVAHEDQAVIEELWPKRTPDTLTKELMTAGDAAVVKYRDYLAEWDKRGWRIDQDTMAANFGDVAYAIPCPARRESGNWILDPVPLLPPES